MTELACGMTPHVTISIFLVGDLYQLPPVMDRPIFTSLNMFHLNVFIDNILWEEFKMFELNKIMRQKNYIRFISTLNNLAIGNMNQSDMISSILGPLVK